MKRDVRNNMKTPRRVDQQITQVSDLESLLGRFEMTLNVAWTEARLSFQRQLEHYEILSNRIRKIRATLPRSVPGDNVDKLAVLSGVHAPRRSVILLGNGMEPKRRKRKDRKTDGPT
jgi:hypothetical protein